MATEFLELKKLTIFVGEDFSVETVHFTKSCWKRQLTSNLLATRYSAVSKATEAVSAEGNGGFSSVFRRQSIFL